jgi:hypothetical protein
MLALMGKEKTHWTKTEELKPKSGVRIEIYFCHPTDFSRDLRNSVLILLLLK